MPRLSGAWELLGRGTDTTGTLTYLVEHRHRYTSTPPSPFSVDNLGNAGAILIPFANDAWHLTNLYWTQSFMKGRVEVVGGFLDVTDFVDVYPLTSPWTDFLNFGFSIGVGTIDLPDDCALGLAAGAWLTGRLYAIAGFQDLNADPTRPFEQFDTFFDESEFFKHVEIGYTTSPWDEYYLDNLHLMLWHADERESLGAKSGWGAVVSLTRSFGERWIAFARAGYANRGAGLLERSVSVGGSYALSGTSNAPGSQVGFAANWGRPNDALFGPGLDDQYGLEGYLRLQVTRELAVTPSVQLLVDPALDPDTSTTWVFGLRTRLAL